MPHSLDVSPGPVLFGHSARVWDCYVSDSVSSYPYYHVTCDVCLGS